MNNTVLVQVDLRLHVTSTSCSKFWWFYTILVQLICVQPKIWYIYIYLWYPPGWTYITTFTLFVNSTRTSLKHSYFFCFADDMKIFLKIYSVDDCLKLQDDLNSFSVEAEYLGLTFNVNKSRSMVFTRSRPPITFTYTINGSNLIPVDSTILDLLLLPLFVFMHTLLKLHAKLWIPGELKLTFSYIIYLYILKLCTCMTYRWLWLSCMG